MPAANADDAVKEDAGEEDAASDGVAKEDESGEGEVEDALELLFTGRLAEIMPPEELGEFHDFIREEALRRRRFALSFRLDCGCLAWIGYSLSNVVTHEDGIEFKAQANQSYIPDHEADVEHPEGPTEDPPDEFLEWPIWPFEIYQDELEGSEADVGEQIDELADDLGLDEEGDLAGLKSVAAHEDPLVDEDS